MPVSVVTLKRYAPPLVTETGRVAVCDSVFGNKLVQILAPLEFVIYDHHIQAM